jgi:hypothetical protein
MLLAFVHGLSEEIYTERTEGDADVLFPCFDFAAGKQKNQVTLGFGLK